MDNYGERCDVCGQSKQPSCLNHPLMLNLAGTTAYQTNGAGVPMDKLHQSPGRPKGARNLHAKHPSSMGKAFKRAGLDWQADFAQAIKANKRDRIKLWLRLLPYLVTTTNRVRVRKWKGKASKAALIALDALEGK